MLILVYTTFIKHLKVEWQNRYWSQYQHRDTEDIHDLEPISLIFAILHNRVCARMKQLSKSNGSLLLYKKEEREKMADTNDEDPQT